MKEFCVKSHNMEFIVVAKDWYNAIQIAYDQYTENRKETKSKLISYIEFRDYCNVESV